MTHNGRTAGALAGTLVAALLLAAPTTAAPTGQSAGPAPISTPGSTPAVLAAKKKPSRGVLRVKVTGTGSYTVRSKGYRKTGTATKTFRVKPGRYTVKAPGAAVTPKKTVRVRKGKTTTVRVRFPLRTPAPGPTPPPAPVQPPVSGPVSQWVQAGTEATVSTTGGYAIHIPAGVLQQSTTVRVTPLDAAPGGLPGAAFHIDGAWSGAMQVTLPVPDTSGGAVMLHEAGNGLRITSGNQADRGTAGGVPTVTASVTSLSTFWSASIDCAGVSEVAHGLLCADQADLRIADWLTAAGSQAAEAVQTDQVSAAAVSSDCPNSTPAMPSSGDLAKGIDCSESLSGSWGEWGFTNTTHASYLGGLYSAGAVYDMNTTGTYDRSVDRPDDIPFILWPIYEPLKDWDVFPTQKTNIRKTTGSGPSTITTDPDPGVTPLWASTGFLTGLVGGELIDDLVADPNTNLAAKISACMPQGSTSLSSSVVNCVKTSFIEALEYYAKKAPLLKKARAAGALAKVLSAGDVLMIGASFWLALEAKIGGGLDNRLTLEKIEPDLGIDPPTHPKTVNTYIARDPGTGRSVLVDRGRVTVIGTGTLFNCLARTRAVWDIPNLKALNQPADGTQISCYDEGPAWTYTPTAQGGNTGTNIILRDSANPGHNWLINSNGEIQTIEDGGTYLCLASSNPVIWNTPDDKITAWTPVGTEPAHCGNTLPDATGAVSLVSSDSDGNPGDASSGEGVWSPDGARIAFISSASNLVSGDTNDSGDVFLKTLATGAIQRINTDSAGNQASGGWSHSPVWSPDGTRIAFISSASNLVSGDTNDSPDVFVKTLATGAIQRISTNSNGDQANKGNFGAAYPDWSPDGTRIVFTSDANNLVPHDTDDIRDVFVKTLATGAIQRINTDASGHHPTPGPYGTHAPTWSPDSGRIAFCSDANVLVPEDKNSTMDVFVKTLATGAITRINTAADGTPPDHGPLTMGSCYPDWSPDGTKVAFASFATNLVPNDTNDNSDVFIKTLSSGAIKRISTDSVGNQLASGGWEGSFAWSPDGTGMILRLGDGLVPSDNNGASDVFLKDIATEALQRLSTDSEGNQIPAGAYDGHMSPDATRIAFTSGADNLVPNDTNSKHDLFVKAID